MPVEDTVFILSGMIDLMRKMLRGGDCVKDQLPDCGSNHTLHVPGQ
jgi:hypothetical protein